MEKIKIIPANPQNAAKIYSLIDSCRSYLREWLSWVDLSGSPDDTERYIREFIGGDIYTGRMNFEIYFNDELCGMIDLHNGNEIEKSVEIGYWLGEQFQGKGIVTEACKQIINLAFAELDVEIIYIKCAEGNLRSRHIPERLGFSISGTEEKLQLNSNIPHRLIVYKLNKEELIKPSL
ncbi:MAG: GNAT family protein [Ignavibacteriaceae bacterium]